MFKFLNKFNKFIFTEIDSIPEGYKSCDNCSNGWDTPFTKCEICNGEGILKLPYEEYVETLP